MADKKRSFLRFPDFKRKAVTLSYDDAVRYDEKLLEIITPYGLKCTFNVNSNAYGSDDTCLRMPKEKAYKLFTSYDCEIASHGARHLSLTEVDKVIALKDIIEDRRELEKTYKKLVQGFVFANGFISEEMFEYVRSCGFKYARTTLSSYNFDIPTDWIRLSPTCRHVDPKLMELVDDFLTDNVDRHYWWQSPKLFYLWGHSYEFNNDNNWEVLENFAKKVGNRDDVWYATNIEVVDYVTAFDNLVFSVSGERVYNPSDIDVYICYFGKEYLIKKGQTVEFDK